MSTLTRATVSVAVPAGRALPADLRGWLPADRLLALACEAAGVVSAEPAFRNPRFEKFSAPMMLGLLGYCYATNSFGSKDIEWDILNEVLLSRFCSLPPHEPGGASNERTVSENSLPDAQAIRRFRRAYRPWLLQSLVCLLKKAMTEQAEKSGVVSDGTCADMVDWASRKIQMAILMDASAAD